MANVKRPLPLELCTGWPENPSDNPSAEVVTAIRAGLPVSDTLDPRKLDPLRRRNLREALRAVSEVQESIGAHPEGGRR